MAYRLCAEFEDRTLRFGLGDGTYSVGSSAECDVKVTHPTVSRRHATIAVSGDEVVLTDTGSSNGTRVDGRRIAEPTRVDGDTVILLGSVELRLQPAEAGDLELGAPLPAPMVADKGQHDTDPPQALSTIGPAVLEAFGLGCLPDLARRVARGDTTVEVAQAVGAALLRTMPCRAVEIARAREAEGDELLFSASREMSGEDFAFDADAGSGLRLRVAFRSQAFADVYGPLVDTAAALVQAAGRVAVAERSPRPAFSPPEPPRPPSVVHEVREIYNQAAQIARSRVSVLVRGESGTGKELVARYLHAASERADHPLVTLNCAALPRDLLESELFGVERGVATGVDARPGKFEVASGGTLLLDEIGDMAPETQAKILRVLEEGEVYRIGGHTPRQVDLRVISATNRDIDAMLAEGRFRLDLYHRIADWVVELPPLRRRRADIPNLAVHFLARACVERGVQAAGISRSAIDALVAYDWPGNVRQLEKEMTRAALFLGDGDMLDTSRLQPTITSRASDSRTQTLKEVRETAERRHIAAVLAECHGVVADAADRLGVGLSTLYQRMKALDVDPSRESSIRSKAPR